MRDVSINDKPPICAAIDEVIGESIFTNRAIANALGTTEQNVGRWRGRVSPSRDDVARLEEVLNKPLGYISRVAGYVEDTSADDLLALVDTTPSLPENEREYLRAALEGAMSRKKKERRSRVG